MPIPLVWLVVAGGEEGLFESTVEPFDETVGLWVIRGGRMRPNAPCLHELGPCVGEKLHPSVGRDGGWDSVVRDPSERETIHDRFDGHVLQWDRGWPTCESVDNCEDILVSVGLTECDDVEIDVVETLRGDREIADRWNSVFDYLGSLAVDALTSPFRHVLSERGPDEFFGDGLSSPFDTGVSETVKGVKNSASP